MKKWLIAHSKTGNVQDELRTSCYSRKQVLSKTDNNAMSEEQRSQLTWPKWNNVGISKDWNMLNMFKSKVQNNNNNNKTFLSHVCWMLENWVIIFF